MNIPIGNMLHSLVTLGAFAFFFVPLSFTLAAVVPCVLQIHTPLVLLGRAMRRLKTTGEEKEESRPTRFRKINIENFSNVCLQTVPLTV